MSGLGAPANPADDIMRYLRAISKHVVVIIGPAAQEYWRLEGCINAADNVHTHALCGFCTESALHCTCEHIYTALIDMKKIDLKIAKHPKRRGQAQALALELSPGPSAAAHGAKRANTMESPCGTRHTP
eukprot:11467905-Karenia_brevis.AAC.1